MSDGCSDAVRGHGLKRTDGCVMTVRSSAKYNAKKLTESNLDIVFKQIVEMGYDKAVKKKKSIVLGPDKDCSKIKLDEYIVYDDDTVLDILSKAEFEEYYERT